MRAFFFIHVMKTAGTTFVRQLQQQFPAEAIYPTRGIDWTSPTDVDAYINIPRLLSISADRRAQVQIYTGHFPFMVCDLIDPEPVALTVLREPVERTISVLKQFKRREERFRDWSLESIYEDRPIFRFFVENHQTKVFSLAPEDNEVAINCGLTIDDARFARARENLAARRSDRLHRVVRRRSSPRSGPVTAGGPGASTVTCGPTSAPKTGTSSRRSASASPPTTPTTSSSTSTGKPSRARALFRSR